MPPFELMHALVESPPLDLPLEQWPPLYRLAVDHEPDLILELGRGWGNSTCVLTEAANTRGARVVSVGFDSEHAWETRTAPRLRRHVGAGWFRPLTVLQADITELDFGPVVAGAGRVLVFWDAHGSDVAAAILERLLPLLPRGSLVVVDDVWRAGSPAPLPLEHEAGPLGSPFEEVEPLWRYLSDHGIAPEYGERWISFTMP